MEILKKEKSKLTPRKIGLIGLGVMTIPIVLAYGVDLGYIDLPVLQGYARDLLAVPTIAFLNKALTNKNDLKEELFLGIFFSFTTENIQSVLNKLKIEGLEKIRWDPKDYLFYIAGALGWAVANFKETFANLKEFKKKLSKDKLLH